MIPANQTIFSPYANVPLSQLPRPSVILSLINHIMPAGGSCGGLRPPQVEAGQATPVRPPRVGNASEGMSCNHQPFLKPSQAALPALSHDQAKAAPILESNGIKVTLNEKQDFFKCVAITCKSWLCDNCRRVKGFELRKRFINKAEKFKAPRLYTITVNRDWFSSPEEAYHYVMDNKFISRLLTKELGITRWVWVLEVQEANGDGWPHWHILIDVGDLPGMWYQRQTGTFSASRPDNINGWSHIPHFFDLDKVHRLLRKWKIGEQCYLSIKKDTFDNGIHAIRYITKYLIKTPAKGFPRWMYYCPGIRFYQPSRSIGSLDETTGKELPKTASHKPKRKPAIPLLRVSECREKVAFITEGGKSVAYTSNGTKESIALFPGVVIKKEAAPDTQKEFNTLGFSDISEIIFFSRAWESPDFKALREQRIQNKKDYLLARWQGS